MPVWTPDGTANLEIPDRLVRLPGGLLRQLDQRFLHHLITRWPPMGTPAATASGTPVLSGTAGPFAMVLGLLDRVEAFIAGWAGDQARPRR